MDQDPTGSGARPDSDGASTLDLSGRCVGSSYILIRPIGQGATGTVWRGVDRASGEPVAVKLLHESLLRQPKLVTRFVQERTILLMLRHRNVVRVRDLFSVGESLGLVMDLVPGGSLRDHLREHHTLAPGEAARLAAEVAAALAEAHDLGIVHRDLKPDNILLHREDGRLEIRLTDFGIARVLNTPRLTTTHAVVGTPHYMAPEAFQSSATSPAADVYALGVLLYEMVCGRPPYDSDTVHDLMRLHLEGRPERLDGIPDALWEIINSCLEQKPRLRPTTGELIADLSDVARATGDAPALPKPDKSPREPAPVSPPPVSLSPPPGPSPARPVHPSLAGMRKLPPPQPRNQAASWRWGRPWAMTALVVAAVVASGVTTTAWHLGRADGDPGRAAEVVQPTLRPTLSPAASRSPSPRATTKTRTARDRPPIAAQALTPVRPQKTPRTTKATTTAPRTPVREAKKYGPDNCNRGFTVANFSTPVVFSPCHSLGAKVQFHGLLAVPSTGDGRIVLSVRDVGSGRTVGSPKVCGGLRFSKDSATHDCGTGTVAPPRGHRYQVILEWLFQGAGRQPAGGIARGNEFDW